MKFLFGIQPEAWLEYVGLPAQDAEMLDEDWQLLDTDVSTVTAAADLVLLLKREDPSIAHIEFQAGPDRKLVLRLLRYNILLDFEHELPVDSVLVLLRKEADSPQLTGRFTRFGRDGSVYLDFFYRIV